MQKRKLSSRQTLLRFIKAYKETVSDDLMDLDVKALKPYLTKTFLGVKQKSYLLAIPDNDIYGLKVYSHTMTDEMMLNKLTEIVETLTSHKDKPFLDEGVDKMLVEYANELYRENQKRTSLKALHFILKGVVKVSQAVKTTPVIHDFELQTEKGLRLCRMIKESKPNGTDKKGNFGFNPLSIRIKKMEDER